MTPQAELEDVLLDLYRPADLARWLSRRFGRAALNGLSDPDRTRANQWVHEAVDGLDRQSKLPEVIAAMALEHPHKADALQRIAAALKDRGGLVVADGLVVAEVREEQPVSSDPPARGIVINNPVNVQIIEQGDGYIVNGREPSPLPPADPTDDLLRAIIDAHKRLGRFQRWVPADRTLREVMVTVKVSGWGPGKGPEDRSSLDTPMPQGPLGELTLGKVLDKPDWGIRWILRGHPGSGKTTMLRRLTVERAEEALTAREKGQAWILPLFVSLPNWAASRHRLVQYLVEELGVPHSTPILRRALSEGQALLLFDGLDEVEPTRVQRVTQRITTLAESWPSVPMIVTSRFQGYSPIPAPFTGPGQHPAAQPFGMLHLQPLSPAAQRQLVMNWLPPQRAEALLERVWADLSLKEMVEVPLLLTMICLGEDRRLKAPVSSARPSLRTEVYEEVLTLLLLGNPVSGGQNRATLSDVASAREALEELALELVKSGGVEWSRRTLSRALKNDKSNVGLWAEIKQEYGGVDAFLARVEDATGLLFPVDGPRQRFRFLHRSLLEYLAACALERRGEGWRRWVADVVRDRANLGRWAEVFSLLAGRLTQERAKALLEALIGIDQGLGLRALATCDAVEPEDVVALLAGERSASWRRTPQVNKARGAALIGLWQRGHDPARIVRAMERFVHRAPPVDLALAWMALQGRSEPEAGVFKERRRFFAVAGRPVRESGLRWLTLDRAMSPTTTGVQGQDHQQPRAFSAVSDRSGSSGSLRITPTPVTVSQYERFAPEHAARREWDVPGVEQHPVVNVCWYEAMIYACWAGARLPTEGEWEAARRLMPQEEAWHLGNSGGQTRAVRPDDLSDLVGNVWEWCQGPEGEFQPVRGGSWRSVGALLSPGVAGQLSPWEVKDDVGFRLVRDALALVGPAHDDGIAVFVEGTQDDP
ncbi:MAG: SUMF1/EgtB/PvdO family nonheme iron enzyme [Alphaproteobacteria bacterium]|nr:SUMF1/EgtB/PvdO family nonheme iron enzyme [Alphaproteobacteria bacterium]